MLLIIISLIAWVVLHRSVYGRYLFATGRNPEAARYAGINTKWIVTMTYVIAGALTAISGIIFAFYTNSVSPANHGNAYELYGIAAAVLGGCSLRGGEGSIVGVILGTILLQELQNLVNLLGIPSSLNFAVMGGVILIGVLVDQQWGVFRARRRIAEAALELHSSVGPALTTISMVAERAGVQRHTLYKHFPDERSLLLACSGLAQERDPMPDAAPWRAIDDRGERLRVALGAVYGWYARNRALMACVTRDAATHAPTREIVELRRGPVIAAYMQVLGGNCGPLGLAALRLALDFHSWSTLVLDAGLSQDEAVTVMVCAVLAAERPSAA